ncbi:hypothetical protein [Neobacillus sp. D3-1R]|uniref:hypothetical protein n=1 Tax=Neobacillus sp. D3-1R TaxID=3445778 RepID=UPI003F9ED0F7
MSLNNWQHPSKVFKPAQPKPQSNQESFRLNFLSEFVSKQISQNHNLNQSMNEIIHSVEQSHQKMDFIICENENQKNQSDVFLEKVINQEKLTEEVLSSLNNLREQQSQLSDSMMNEKWMNEAILDQLSFQDQQLRNTNLQLENYVNLAQNLSLQLVQQEKILKEMDQKIQVHDIYHSTVMDRLDKQDAFNEKVIRQIDHLKSILYERVSNIIEKIESSYHSTTDYFNGIINQSGFMKPFLLSTRPKEKSEKEKETKPN